MQARFQATRNGRSQAVGSILAAAAIALLLSGCGGSATPTPAGTAGTETAAPAGSTAAATATDPATPIASGPGSASALLVLGDAGELWVVGPDGMWTRTGSVAGGRAVARDGAKIAFATPSGVELRDAADPSTTLKTTAVEWGSGAGSYPAALDVSNAGAVAAAIVSGDSIQIVVAPAGASQATPLSPAPASPFAPSVAWLDDSRLLVLSTDAGQVSRLAIVDTSAHSIQLLTALAGVRTFSLSRDRKTVAAATAAGLYVGSVADLVSGMPPVLAVAATDKQVIWATAVDSAGGRVAFLSGTPADDGSVGSPHEMVMELRSGAWASVLDVAAPTSAIRGQVWLP